MSELVTSYEISKFDFAPKGNYLACVLCSGEVNIYDGTQYTVVPMKLNAVKAETSGKSLRLKKCLAKMGLVKEQIREILEIEKLRTILGECGEYPETYRTKIWEHLLELPHNMNQYNAIINNRMIISFKDLCRKYPLEDKRSLKNLKQLLDNLVTWCPFFLHVDYLPLFVFPFVKIFVNKPLACFEAVCTIIVNWCQFWFEYFPLPPVNILAMIENVLMEHDPELLAFLIKKNISSELYAWPILRTAFSEILTATAWKTFWDHVLTNQPSFLLCGVVAYNILQRVALLNLKDQRQFKSFYNTHHPVDVKKLLKKTYRILSETNESIHPRQYLNMFKKIQPGEYPSFSDYPKTIIEMKSEKSRELEEEMEILESDEIDLYRKRFLGLNKIEDAELQEEENRRILEMESVVKKQLLEEQDRLRKYYERVAKLRTNFQHEDQALSTLRSKIAKDQQLKSRQKYLSSILDDVRFKKNEKDYKLTKNEDELFYHYGELLKNKDKIERILSSDELVQKEQVGEVGHVSLTTKPRDHLRASNLATGLDAIDGLIKKIENQLEREKHGVVDDSEGNKEVVKLQVETKELASEVGNLIQLLADLRNVEVAG